MCRKRRRKCAKTFLDYEVMGILFSAFLFFTKQTFHRMCISQGKNVLSQVIYKDIIVKIENKGLESSRSIMRK